MSKWEHKTLGKFLSLQRGHDLTVEEREFGTVPVMGAAGQNGFHNKALASAPGVIVGRSGGSFGQIHLAKEDFWPHNTALYVTDFKGNDPYFTYYFLKNLDFSQLNSGSAQPSLNRNYVYPTKIVVPLPNEQKKIAAVLSALDAKIDLNNRINAELEAMAKTLYDYWFVQFDFPDKDGKPYKSSGGKMVWNKELKREIPEGWEVRSLSEITNVSNEQLNPIDAPEKEYKHYSIPAFDAIGTYKVEKGEEIKSNKFVVKEVDVLVSKLNPWFSRVIYATDDTDLISSTEFVIWRTDNINKKNYLYMIARDATFVTYCTKSATGTSNSHKRINPTVMMKYKVAFNEQTADSFGAVLGSTIKMYAKNQIENNNLSSLRDWLLPMLMNGQVKVS